MEFAQRLNKMMAEKEVTAYRLSKALGIHQTTVKNWIDGKSKPRTEYMEKIAGYFGVSLDYLIGNNNEPHTQNETFDTTEIIIKPLNAIPALKKLIDYDPGFILNFISRLCRNERIEQDLTERFIANSAGIPLNDYLNFEVNSGELPLECIINIFNILSIDVEQVSGYLEGHISATIESNSEREHFLYDCNIRHSESVNRIMMKILQFSSDDLNKLIKELETKFPGTVDDRSTKYQKVIDELYTNKIRPRKHPKADQ